MDKILIGTVVNQLKKAKLSGNLCMTELYLMRIIDGFINECNNFYLSDCQIDKLKSLHKSIQNSNSYICKTRNKPKTHFFKSLNTNINNYFGEMANFNITTNAQENLPPTEIGDGSKTINYSSTLTFTRADFTSNTTPPYSDPEGDAASLLKILSLPGRGTIKLNNVNVTVNQIISFDDIDAGLLTYESDPSITNQNTEGFTFAIADEGSSQFTS